ncbi:MAG: YbaB/EbfC family nucleoid-associated protein [Pseudomonadota bacterium]|nr:YbaB/EbfC family nucleoid-associated protein [Pseudomonadota bacterium]
MKGIGDLMKQAQEVQSRLTDVQNEMAKIEVTGESGAGLVQVIMNCRYGVTRVSIDSSLFGEEKQMLEDLVAAACNDAVKKVEQTQAEKMSELTGGLNLPFGNLGG